MNIESSETELGDYLFSTCKNLTKVNLPENMTHIPKGFLQNCYALENFDMPEGLVSIGYGAFYYCKALKSINLPDTLESIGDYAFKYCDAFTEITIPSSVETYGKYIFSGCEELMTVNLPQDLKVIPEGLLCECGSIEYITLPENLEGIENSAFSCCDGLKEINLPNTLKHIGNNAFTACHQLTEVSVPDSVTDLGDRAFSYCVRLKTVKLPKGMQVIPTGLFALCSALETVQYPDVVTEYSGSVFSGCYSLKEAYLPDTLTAIGDYTFKECWTITDIKLPESIETYGTNIFEDCNKLENVSLPENMKTLPYGMFEDCTGLKTLKLPEKLEVLGDHVFCQCYNLQEIEIPERVQSIGDFAFYGCSALDKITLPDSVETVGSGAFRGCKRLKELMLPEKVTVIEYNTFYECTGLENIVIPAGVTEIGTSAFAKCDILKDVYFCGTENEWKLIAIDSGNQPLTTATVHYNGTKDSGELPGGLNWDISVRHVLNIRGDGVLQGFKSETDVPWYKHRDKIEKINIRGDAVSIGSYAFAGLNKVTTVYIPESMMKIDTKAFSGCTALTKVLYLGSLEAWDDIEIGEENESLLQAKVISLKITDFTDNQNITINYAGSAIAYYRTEPNTWIEYVTDATIEGHTCSDDNGIFKIDLGTYTDVGRSAKLIRITKFGDERLDPSISIWAAVEVTPLSYTQKWEASLGAEAKATISEGVGIKTPLFEVKAAVWEVSAGAGISSAMTMSLEHSGEKESFEIVSEKGVSGNIGAESGITGEALDAKLTIVGAEAGVAKASTVSYGLKFDDFSIENFEQQRALGTFFLGEALMANPNNLFFLPLYLNLRDYVYSNTDCTVIEGSAAKVSGEFGDSAGSLEVNEKNLFSAANCDFNATVSNSQTKYSDGTLKKKLSLVSDIELSLITENIFLGESIFSKRLLSSDLGITASDSPEGAQLETESLVSKQDGESNLIKETWSSVYDHYTFKGESLMGIAGKDRPLATYVFGSTAVLNLVDLVNIAKGLSNGVDSIEYSQENKDNELYSFDFDLGGQIIIGAELATSLSYLEELSYTTATGLLAYDEIHYTTQSVNLQKSVDDATISIDEMIRNSVKTLAEKAKTFFKELPGKIQEGIDNFFVSIKEKTESVHNWILSLTYADLEGYQMEATSYTIKSTAPRAKTTAQGLRGAGNYTETNAATVSRPFVIRVTDGDTGETVTDLSVAPLTVTVRYTQDDLESASLNPDSDVVRDGGIALYRYSDNGDYFEYIGGENDLAAMTVTAEITKPGQYVLAVDSCAPQIKKLDLSDYRSNPTITAYVDDLSGLNVSSLVFKLDGQVKVDNSNMADHYSVLTGKFTYTVPENEPLTEGKHTMSFTLADTTGNVQTYEYSFHVDLTAPVISDVIVTGTTNADSCVLIRAEVSDEHLTGVYAVFSKLQADGSWSLEVRTEMGDVGDGQWGLDYEGDGSVIRVYVRAVDIGDNTANSKTFEAYPLAEDLSLAQNYIAIEAGESAQLLAMVRPAGLDDAMQWSTEDASTATVDENGVITGKKVGTTYVIATVSDGENTFSDRCRVDVSEAVVIDGVQLSANKVTTELYRTDYATFDILLKLPQNYTTQAENAAAAENRGVAMESARFTDEVMAKFFDLVVLDDRTVQIVPTAEALENPKSVKGSYKGTVTVAVKGEEYETERLTLSVKKTLPKLKASVAAFNSFYAGQAQPIVITGGTVTNITLDPNKKQPEWLNLVDGKLVLNEKAPAKSTSGKVNLLVETEEWAIPAALTLTVKNAYKVPSVKLATTSVTVSNRPGPAGVALRLVPTNKADTISGIGITGITVPEGYSVENFNEADGTFVLMALNGFKAGKLELKVNFGATTITLKLTVKTQAVKLKLSASKVSLNKTLGDVATVTVNCLTAGYDVTDPVLTYDNQMLDVNYADGKLTVSAKDAAAYGKSYPVTISAYEGAPAVKLNVAILKQNAAVKSTIKATGFIDVIRSSTAITVKPTYTNALNVDVDENAVLKIYSSADKFKNAIAEVKSEEGIFTIDKSVISDQTLKYKAQLETKFNENIVKSNMISLTVKMGAAKLTVKSEGTTLFAKDKNDRVEFSLATADAALNGITRVEFKNARQAALLELIDYGDGTYAIGFKDGKVDKSLIGKSVTVPLNIFLEGNRTAKANATVNIKLTIVK